MSFVVEIPSVFTKPTQIPVRLGNTILTGNETIQGSLSVNGSLTLNSGDSVDNTNVVYYDSLDISNTLNVGGNVSISGDLFVDDITSTTHNVSTLNSSTITASNVSITGDLTVSGYIDRKNNIIRRHRINNESLGSVTDYQVIYGSVGYSNDDLVTTTNSDIYTIVKAGRYKISTTVIFDNGSYTDRLNWRLTLYKNNATSAALGQAFCYTRHKDYATYGSTYHSSIVDFIAGDTFYYLVECNRGTATGFNSTMSDSFVLNGTCLEIEYLG